MNIRLDMIIAIAEKWDICYTNNKNINFVIIFFIILQGSGHNLMYFVCISVFSTLFRVLWRYSEYLCILWISSTRSHKHDERQHRNVDLKLPGIENIVYGIRQIMSMFVVDAFEGLNPEKSSSGGDQTGLPDSKLNSSILPD